MSDHPLSIGDDVADHRGIIRDGHVESVVVPLDEYRALKALEQLASWLIYVGCRKRGSRRLARHGGRPVVVSWALPRV
jgi:hypothetical protein